MFTYSIARMFGNGKVRRIIRIHQTNMAKSIHTPHLISPTTFDLAIHQALTPPSIPAIQ